MRYINHLLGSVFHLFAIWCVTMTIVRLKWLLPIAVFLAANFSDGLIASELAYDRFVKSVRSSARTTASGMTVSYVFRTLKPKVDESTSEHAFIPSLKCIKMVTANRVVCLNDRYGFELSNKKEEQGKWRVSRLETDLNAFSSVETLGKSGFDVEMLSHKRFQRLPVPVIFGITFDLAELDQLPRFSLIEQNESSFRFSFVPDDPQLSVAGSIVTVTVHVESSDGRILPKVLEAEYVESKKKKKTTTNCEWKMENESIERFCDQRI